MCLSDKHQAFINSLFLHNMNATEAYCDVYGVDREAGSASGTRLLGNVRVAQEIKRRVDARAMKADEVLMRLSDIARGDIGDLLDIESMSFDIDLRQAKDKGMTKLIRKVKQITKTTSSPTAGDIETNIQELEMYSSLEALQTLAKIHGLMIDKQEQSGEVTLRVVYDRKDAPSA